MELNEEDGKTAPMYAVTNAIHHGHEARHSDARGPSHEIDTGLDAEHAPDGGHDAGGEDWDCSGDDGNNAGYRAR